MCHKKLFSVLNNYIINQIFSNQTSIVWSDSPLNFTLNFENAQPKGFGRHNGVAEEWTKTEEEMIPLTLYEPNLSRLMQKSGKDKSKL